MSAPTLIEWADMIDNRLEAIGGRTADTLARMLRRVAAEFEADCRDHDLALRDAVRETASYADELGFWRYQAIFWRAYAYDSRLMSASPAPEDEETWRTAERDLEATRVAENRERVSHAEASRDPGGT
jgi:hypothetical protein